jgi:predicted phosphoribosyltransferase
MFKDRTEAGIQLAKKLSYLKQEDLVVLAIPRGGLAVAYEVAKALNAPLDVVLTKKIGHPLHKEYAIGAVSLENEVLTDTAQISKAYIAQEIETIRKKLKVRHDQYYKDAQPINLKNKTAVIIDDGIATGNTILVTVDLIMKQQPKSIIVAIPVAPPSAIRNLERHPNIDAVVCLDTPINFRAVGQFYETFEQVSDEEAIAILEAHRIPNI